MAILDVVLGPTQGDRLWSIPVAWGEGDRCRAVADLGVVGVVITEGDRHVICWWGVEHHGQRVSGTTLIELGVAATGADHDPRHPAAVNHANRHAGCRHSGAVARITGAAHRDREAGVLVTVENTILHCADRDGLGDVPVARGEGDCCWRGADLSIERGNG